MEREGEGEGEREAGREGEIGGKELSGMSAHMLDSALLTSKTSIFPALDEGRDRRLCGVIALQLMG